MNKTAILVVKDTNSVTAEEWAHLLGKYVDNVYGPGLKKEIYALGKGSYSLGPKGMEKIITKYGKNIIVGFEWVSRMVNKQADFGYFYNLVANEGVEFCFSYDKFVWNKKSGLSTVAISIERAEEKSKEKSDNMKMYLNWKKKHEN